MRLVLVHPVVDSGAVLVHVSGVHGRVGLRLNGARCGNTRAYRHYWRAIGGHGCCSLCTNTVEGCTDAVQPVDSGLGREMKRQIGIVSGEWLDTDANLDRWEGTDKPLQAWERRVLMAQWAGEAWKRVCSRPHMLHAADDEDATSDGDDVDDEYVAATDGLQDMSSTGAPTAPLPSGALETDLLGLVVVGVEVDGRSWSHVINACIACLHATVLQTALVWTCIRMH